ncbi:MAG: hypothetical protein WA855_12060, partial [Candidatus Acidiferrales bacterium]
VDKLIGHNLEIQTIGCADAAFRQSALGVAVQDEERNRKKHETDILGIQGQLSSPACSQMDYRLESNRRRCFIPLIELRCVPLTAQLHDSYNRLPFL